MKDKFLSADIFRVISSASSWRTPRGSARFRAESGGVRRKIILAEDRRIRTEPGGVGAFPREFARNRCGRFSAEPIADVCHHIGNHSFRVEIWQRVYRVEIETNRVKFDKNSSKNSNKSCKN